MDFVESPIVDGEINVGVFFKLGTEVHFEIYPEYRHWWITQRRKIKKFMQALLDEEMITTRTAHNQTFSLRLIPILGFIETWRDEQFVYYVLERLPFERKSNEA